MHRTEGDNHDDHEFTNGPPATTIEDDWLNSVQEEICEVIEDAGITLKTAATETNNQLLAALIVSFCARAAAPGSAAASGTPGQIAYDATHIYVCIGTDTWVRGGLAAW